MPEGDGKVLGLAVLGYPATSGDPLAAVLDIAEATLAAYSAD
jgi:hypothetical protein